MLLPRAFDPARIAAHLAITDRRVHDRVQQPVRLRHRDRSKRTGLAPTGVEPFLPPPPYVGVLDVGQVHVVERWRQVVLEQAPVQLDRPRLKYVVVDPTLRVHAERHLARVRVQPVAALDLCFLEREPHVGIALGGEGLRGWPVDTVWSLVAGLPAPGG